MAPRNYRRNTYFGNVFLFFVACSVATQEAIYRIILLGNSNILQ